MDDFKAMYFSLFNRVSEAIETLQNAQRETEAIFIEQEEGEEKRVDKAGQDAYHNTNFTSKCFERE